MQRGYWAPAGAVGKTRACASPGAYDALAARLVEKAGFEAVYVTGFGAAVSLLGRPHVGLLTLSEVVDNARRIAQADKVPIVADNGYVNPIIIRTVQEYKATGV
jgi:2,3-dimethylmalate lyase